MGCAREVVARPTVVYVVVSLPVSFGFNRLRRLQRLSAGCSCGVCVFRRGTAVGVWRGGLAFRDNRNLQVPGRFFAWRRFAAGIFPNALVFPIASD